jgi:hypothetical protein
LPLHAASTSTLALHTKSDATPNSSASLIWLASCHSDAGTACPVRAVIASWSSHSAMVGGVDMSRAHFVLAGRWSGVSCKVIIPLLYHNWNNLGPSVSVATLESLCGDEYFGAFPYLSALTNLWIHIHVFPRYVGNLWFFCDFVIFLWKFTKSLGPLFVNFHKKITKKSQKVDIPTSWNP